MICKLCKSEKPLKKSHIIPEFIYSSLYDEKHRFYEISLEENKRNNFLQKGIREPLLCGDCEQLFSKYERYTSLLLKGGFPLKVRNEGRFVYFKGIEYTKFKLFSLSILWRASASSLEVFSEVKLGPHEEILRRMLLAGDPGEEHLYPFILLPIIHDSAGLDALIVSPTRTRLDGHCAYHFLFGGVAWVFLVSSHTPPNAVVDASISKSGELKMLSYKLTDMKFIVEAARELVQQGKL